MGTSKFEGDATSPWCGELGAGLCLRRRVDVRAAASETGMVRVRRRGVAGRHERRSATGQVRIQAGRIADYREVQVFGTESLSHYLRESRGLRDAVGRPLDRRNDHGEWPLSGAGR